jgi:hypothetical protein
MHRRAEIHSSADACYREHVLLDAWQQWRAAFVERQRVACVYVKALTFWFVVFLFCLDAKIAICMFVTHFDPS